MQLFERLCATFLHTMPHLFPPAVSIVVKMSSPHCRMQKEGGILMRLPWPSTLPAECETILHCKTLKGYLMTI